MKATFDFETLPADTAAPKEGKFVLIHGQFIPTEAMDVLVTLLNNKLHYHELKNFLSEERFGRKNKFSEERIESLLQSKKEIIDMIEFATQHGYRLQVDSDIKIKLVKA